MTRYVITGSKFKPFSYAELIQPIQLAEATHQAVEDQYNELSTKANVWDKLAGEQPDSKVSTLYRDYANDLRNQANQLAKEGLTPSSRQGLLEMKSRYSTDIIPIEQAYNARAAEAAEQLAGKAKGIVYEGDASLSSLDRYLYNPQIRYGMADSQEGYKRVYNSAKALQDQLRNYGNGERLDYYTKTWLQEHGYKQDEANQAIKDIQEALMSGDNIRGNNILSDILAQEMNTSGVANWSNNAARVDYFNRVSPAIYAAVGETKVSPYEDYGRRLSARIADKNPKPKRSTSDIPQRVWSPVPVTKVGDKNVQEMQEYASLLRSIISNPDLISSKYDETRYKNVMDTDFFGNITYKKAKETYNPTLDKLSKLNKKYNINLDLDTNNPKSINTLLEVANNFEKEIKSNTQRNNNYILDQTNYDLASQLIRKNSYSIYGRSGNTGIYELNDNDNKKSKKPIDIDKVEEYINDKMSLEFDPRKKYLIIRSVDKSGKNPKSFYIDPEVILGRTVTDNNGNTINMLQYGMDIISNSMEENNLNDVEDGIDYLMGTIYSEFNSVPKVQGKTDSSI